MTFESIAGIFGVEAIFTGLWAAQVGVGILSVSQQLHTQI